MEILIALLIMMIILNMVVERKKEAREYEIKRNRKLRIQKRNDVYNKDIDKYFKKKEYNPSLIDLIIRKIKK
ncbi:MAG: hypothetical protein R3Y64_04755 [Peptostreptococcaceae bacterium]